MHRNRKKKLNKINIEKNKIAWVSHSRYFCLKVTNLVLSPRGNFSKFYLIKIIFFLYFFVSFFVLLKKMKKKKRKIPKKRAPRHRYHPQSMTLTPLYVTTIYTNIGTLQFLLCASYLKSMTHTV